MEVFIMVRLLRSAIIDRYESLREGERKKNSIFMPLSLSLELAIALAFLYRVHTQLSEKQCRLPVGSNSVPLKYQSWTSSIPRQFTRSCPSTGTEGRPQCRVCCRCSIIMMRILRSPPHCYYNKYSYEAIAAIRSIVITAAAAANTLSSAPVLCTTVVAISPLLQQQQQRVPTTITTTHVQGLHSIRFLGTSNTTTNGPRDDDDDDDPTPPRTNRLDPALIEYLSEHVLANQGDERPVIRMDSSKSSSNGGNNNDNNSKSAIMQQQHHQQLLVLFEAIIQNLEPIYGQPVTVAHLQSFGAGLQPLADSIQREHQHQHKQHIKNKSLQQNQQQYVTVKFQIPHHKTELDMPWYFGSLSSNSSNNNTTDHDTDAAADTMTLLELAQTPLGAPVLSEYLEAACGGNASCSTCHVYIDTTTICQDTTPSSSCKIELSPTSQAELDMLDLAFEAVEGRSRLACQVRLRSVATSSECVDDDNSAPPALQVTIPSGVNNMWN